MLFPSLRTAYVVVPKPLISAFRRAVYFAGQDPVLHIQAALADFMSKGYFSTHVRRMPRVYKRRQSIFVEALIRALGRQIPVQRPPGGMQMSLVLPSRCQAEKVGLAAAAAGLHARPLAGYALTGTAPNALHLGFAAVPDHRIEPAAEALAVAILSVG